jgi:hypothetical protein
VPKKEIVDAARPRNANNFDPSSPLLLFRRPGPAGQFSGLAECGDDVCKQPRNVVGITERLASLWRPVARLGSTSALRQKEPLRMLAVSGFRRMESGLRSRLIPAPTTRPTSTPARESTSAANLHTPSFHRFWGPSRRPREVVSGPSSATGGEGVSQSPLKDKAFSTFLGQNPPFELRRKLAFRLQSFHEIHRGSSNWTNLSISVGGGQQDGLAFALRRQRSHVRIVSGAPAFAMT